MTYSPPPLPPESFHIITSLAQYHYYFITIPGLFHSISLLPQPNIVTISLLYQANIIIISFNIITSPAQYHYHFITMPDRFHYYFISYHYFLPQYQCTLACLQHQNLIIIAIITPHQANEISSRSDLVNSNY